MCYNEMGGIRPSHFFHVYLLLTARNRREAHGSAYLVPMGENKTIDTLYGPLAQQVRASGS